MITPSYGLTATERVLPRLALDFTTASLDSRVTFTRALNTATVVNSSGYIAIINADLPRFDYNPITLACKGLLIEETRSNLFTYSEDYTNAAYSFTDISVNANQTEAPDNALTADLWTQGVAGTAVSFRTAGITVAAGATISVSVFAKRSANMQWLRIRASNSANTNGGQAWFDLTNGVLGTVSNAGTGSNTSATITPYKNGFYRLTVTSTLGAADTAANRYIYAVTADNVTTRQSNAAYFVWGEQLEVASFPTSYIPTVATSVTRNADVATMTGTNFSSWFNASEGAITTQFDVIAPTSAGFNRLFAFNDGTTTNTIECMKNNGTNSQFFSYVNVSSSAQALLYSSAISANTSSKISLAYKQNSFAAASNGTALTTDGAGNLPTVDRLSIGYVGSGNQLNGHIQKILYYPQRIINAEVTAFSK